jgi:hypothetical protein
MASIRFASAFRSVVLLGAAAALVASSCTLKRAGTLPLGEGGVGAGGEGGQGGVPQCVTLEDCPLPETQCQERSCAGGWCGLHDLFPGTGCHEEGGQVCDGEGHCVKDDGVECGGGDECLSDHCVDGVCCNTACDGQCESCAADIVIPGACTAFGASLDPQDECDLGVCDGASDCATGAYVFSDEYGDNGPQWPVDIAVGPSDEIDVGGFFGGDVNFGGGMLYPTNEDGFVVKFDGAGTFLWDLPLGAGDDQAVKRVVVDSLGNIVVCGDYLGELDLHDGAGLVSSQGSYDLFLLKLDTDGNHLWSKRIGDPSLQVCRGLALDSQENIILVASLEGSADFGLGELTTAGAGDVVVAKYDPTGVPFWVKQYGGAAQQDAWDVAVDGSDRIVVVGDFLGTLNFDGTVLTANGSGSEDAFVVRFDPSGGHMFSKGYGQQDTTTFGNSVAVDSFHHIIIAGSFTGSINFGGEVRIADGLADGFVVRLDGSGNHQWDHTFGDAQWLSPWAVTVDNSNNVIVGGEFDGQANFGGSTTHTATDVDAFLAKYAADGTYLWSGNYGGNQDQILQSLATNSQREIIVGGHFDSSIHFGGSMLTSNGADMFLAILEP